MSSGLIRWKNIRPALIFQDRAIIIAFIIRFNDYSCDRIKEITTIEQIKNNLSAADNNAMISFLTFFSKPPSLKQLPLKRYLIKFSLNRLVFGVDSIHIDVH